ncbi:hypothetical protein [Kutzneria kofuensis]|uniref:Uncharacterized protein n=1 Tax=Kutzneria kofuensis TaxID=103725 RepID=A0A7W9NFE0_9PSEU|nr:hypothetical protein [Kutzneria kofuensis]MBB5889913.1 hypothetical protein [Kutzneria kofuensis]
MSGFSASATEGRYGPGPGSVVRGVIKVDGDLVGDSFDDAAENLSPATKTELICWPGNAFATRPEADPAIFALH